MTIRKKSKTKKPVLDLTGPDGNAYVLLSVASRTARQLGLDADQIRKEMTAGNYENLVRTFDYYFGDYIILER